MPQPVLSIFNSFLSTKIYIIFNVIFLLKYNIHIKIFCGQISEFSQSVTAGVPSSDSRTLPQSQATDYYNFPSVITTVILASNTID